MNKLVMHRIVVKDPENMEVDPNTGQPICPECDSLFDQCCCPKPWSTLNADGYQIVNDGKQLVAYPSEEVYEGLSLWIFRNGEYIICGHCLQWARGEWHWSGETTLEVVEAFFSIHGKCHDIRDSGKSFEVPVRDSNV